MSAEFGSAWKHSANSESASPVGEEAEVADAHEAERQQVEQEAAKELVDRQSQSRCLLACTESRERKVTLPCQGRRVRGWRWRCGVCNR